MYKQLAYLLIGTENYVGTDCFFLSMQRNLRMCAIADLHNIIFFVAVIMFFFLHCSLNHLQKLVRYVIRCIPLSVSPSISLLIVKIYKPSFRIIFLRNFSRIILSVNASYFVSIFLKSSAFLTFLVYGNLRKFRHLLSSVCFHI